MVGKLSVSMYKFTEGLRKGVLGKCRKEKFCMMQNFPGFPGFGIMDSGEDWKGPISCSKVSASKGPMYLPLSISF